MNITPYLIPFNHPFSRNHDQALRRILAHGRPVAIDEFNITFEVGDSYYEVWRAGRWHSFGSRIFEVEKHDLEGRTIFLPKGALANISSMFKYVNQPGYRPRRRTMIALDRMVKIYEEVTNAQKRKALKNA